MNPKRPNRGLNDTIGKVLRYGVLLSSAVVAAGLALLLASPPVGAPGSLQGVLAVNFGGPTLDPLSLLRGIAGGNAVGILQLGILILLATPIARVVASVLLFLRERDLLYVGITSLVLAMLLLAIFAIGPIEA